MSFLQTLKKFSQPFALLRNVHLIPFKYFFESWFYSLFYLIHLFFTSYLHDSRTATDLARFSSHQNKAITSSDLTSIIFVKWMIDWLLSLLSGFKMNTRLNPNWEHMKFSRIWWRARSRETLHKFRILILLNCTPVK